ncbi:polyketide synthase [Myxococcus stipitatus DSM 14675]|uniref:Polyketide synthase n=1 Tax=Myxococcus stipitatus (strain DSM 14675 / JCM 12634 / Mx s8) TaxID=1278073 RepID=L7UI90_MYXSD|nr:type I polyketide synthase [Myxococcus stipitatus]AGC47277.1 polyketide synthase [Myxococcus stipitatus DSM 14675]
MTTDSTPRISDLPPLKLALLARKVESKLALALSEPIAIVGMGLRFPGGADSPESFWELLREGRDAIAPIPASRWDVDAYYDPTPGTPGKMYTRHGAFIRGVEDFDPQFFGISPREAARMDPHQRLLLEVTWEALERAGLSATDLKGSSTGVFVGMMNEDFSHLMTDATQIDLHTASGSGLSVAAGRLAYSLGLQGPTMAVDAACSSSLVTVHLACQSLRTRECDLALAGGISLILSPLTSVVNCAMRMLSVKGRCSTFDATADGFVRGEGCGMLVLKRLSDAVADRDPILALLRGSATNHSGQSSGLTVPNGNALAKVMRAALQMGGVEPEQVGYMEAHGTGTAIGDPIEMEALGRVFGPSHSKEEPLVVGSVKTNIGHTEGAAGVAGIIKVVLAMQHEEIPAHLNLETPNPNIRWEALPVVVPKERRRWARGAKRRIAGVTAFGFNGTNAHVLIEEAPLVPEAQAQADASPRLLVLSARTAPALQELAGRYVEHFSSPRAFPEVCFTANTGRVAAPHRVAVVARSVVEARERLAGFVRGETPPGVWAGSGRQRPRIAFLFGGGERDGAAWGRRLFESEPVFREAVLRCEAALGRPFASEFFRARGAGTRPPGPSLALPGRFAVRCGLVHLWRAWGVAPATVMGLGEGELAAACAAGVLSWEDGVQLAATLGEQLERASPGAELTLERPEHLADVLQRAPEVCLLGLDDEGNGVLSGARAAIEAVQAELLQRGSRAELRDTSHAITPAVWASAREALTAAARSKTHERPRVPWLSSLTGRSVEAPGPEHWRGPVGTPSQWVAAWRALAASHGIGASLDLGPGAGWRALGRRVEPSGERSGFSGLPSPDDDRTGLLASLAGLVAQGADIAWPEFYRGESHDKVVLPTSCFQRSRYWFEQPAVTSAPNPDVFSSLKEENVEALAGQLDLIDQLTDEQVEALLGGQKQGG